MKVVLINPYELGRQPFALAQPAAWLKEADHQVCCLEGIVRLTCSEW